MRNNKTTKKSLKLWMSPTEKTSMMIQMKKKRIRKTIKPKVMKPRTKQLRTKANRPKKTIRTEKRMKRTKKIRPSRSAMFSSI